MPSTVKAAVLVEPRRIELEEYPYPSVGSDDAVLRVEMAGLCGTDPKFYRFDHQRRPRPLPYPMVLGHEILGWIDSAGPDFLARTKLQIGDRIVVDATAPCRDCRLCQQGLFRFCQDGPQYGTRVSSANPPHLWGAFAEYMYLHPNSVVHRISDAVSPEAATFASSALANGIRWMRAVGDSSIAKPVVIQGTGPQGLASVIAAKESGSFPIIITGLTQDRLRLDLARKLGADVCVDVQTEDVVDVVKAVTDGEMASAVVDVTGSPVALATSVQLVRPMGIVVCSGHGDATIPTAEIARKEVRFQGVWTHSYNDTRDAIRLAERGKYDLGSLISHRFSLEEADLAVRAMGREVENMNPIKAAITP